MPRARCNGLELEYDACGDPADPAILLIMGLGAQMILWHDDFCAELARRRFYVIRYDNRDVGESTILHDAPVPNIFMALQALVAGRPVETPYTLEDMADDTVGLMECLGIERAHVVGASMGGMIAQTLAFRHPSRVLTLTSIMSTTGNPEVPPATPEAMEALMTPPPTSRQANIDRAARVWRVIGSPGFAFDEDEIRVRAGRAYDRGFHPEGVARQFAAVIASGNRKERLRAVTAPTLVIHGADDPLIRVEGAYDTAAAIADSDLLIIDGMGHDLPRAAWPQILDAIARHAAKVPQAA
jgi:pimeloyl-ACP methyl ester carboxylesterase